MFDVAVVGGGPAGCAAAIVVARAGGRVVVLERSGYGTARIGETVPPDIRVPLDRLGVWKRFCTDGHTPSPGIIAAWGRSEPYANDFILNPHGSGWRLDRRRFDEMLASAAENAGAVVCRRTDAVACAWEPSGGWRLFTQGDEGQPTPVVSAPCLIDAAGRGRSLRRQLGAHQVTHDRLVSCVRFMFPVSNEDPGDQRALIEATEHGWWYSARLPDRSLVLVFQTDAGPGIRARWPEHLARAPFTAARAEGMRDGELRLVAANSQRRVPVATPTWLSVGDAAAAHDPITGLGVYWALQSGLAAGEALVSRTGGDVSAVPAYARAVGEAYDRYLTQRVAYYRAEQRWPGSQFWRRRHTVSGPPAGIC
ncbi:MAG: tryptophan 7-halogenase [Actinomycetota bacterium]|nr:tryptophan 7-halogenase [Actinomycetota bacterium]